jgi:hypothetical protein
LGRVSPDRLPYIGHLKPQPCQTGCKFVDEVLLTILFSTLLHIVAYDNLDHGTLDSVWTDTQSDLHSTTRALKPPEIST